MRSKAKEKKRYSLRHTKRKDFRSENEVMAAVRRESKKAYNNLEVQKNSIEVDSKIPLDITNRNNGKHESTVDKRDMAENNENNLQDMAPQNELAEVQENISNEQSNVDESSPVNVELEDKSEPTEEEPVYHALQHAIDCKISSECTVPKCSIAKQFLIHCSTCVKRNVSCTICKAMDIMVCKHAQICEVPLEKCCSIPNCDKVRLMVLEEWVKLKHKHNEMMDRVFHGLMHAKKCTDKECDLLICKNIKSALLHTHNCVQNESCRTKRFVIQLCEHHQQMCCNEFCEVEFCQESIKNRKKENEKNAFAAQQQAYAAAGMANAALQSTHGALMTSGSNQNNTSVVGEGGIYSNEISPWTSNFVPITSEQQQFFYPNTTLSYSALAFDENSADSRQMYNPVIKFPQPFNQCNDLVNVSTDNKMDDTSVNYNISDDERAETMDEDNEQPIDYYQISNSAERVDESGNLLSYAQASPTQEIYYRLWSEKEDSSKTSLPRLSPEDLQMLSRGDDRQILSPVNDNRISYSEVQPNPQEFTLSTSQESESEENIENEMSGEGKTFNGSLSSRVIAKEKMGENCLVDPRLQKGNSSQDNKEECMRPLTQDQRVWGKIDFLKRKIMDDIEIGTETADESDCETLPSYNPNHESIVSPYQPMVADERSYIGSISDERPPTFEYKETNALTQLERSFLTIMEDQKQKKT